MKYLELFQGEESFVLKMYPVLGQVKCMTLYLLECLQKYKIKQMLCVYSFGLFNLWNKSIKIEQFHIILDNV